MTSEEHKLYGPGEVDAELAALLFNALRSGWALAGAGAGVACYVACVVRTPVSIVLAACVALMSVVRAGVVLAYPGRTSPSCEAEQARSWARRYGATAIVIGLLMGLVNAEAILRSPSVASICFAWAAAGAFGCVTRAATVPWIAKGFSLALLLPTAVAALASPERPLQAAGVLAIAALPVAFQCTRHLYETFYERIRVRREFAYRASHDDLTGLLNRAALAERMTALSAHARNRSQGFALLLLDLDGFKGVNDAHGHFVGDALLRVVARRLEARLGPQDFAARLGGDEFAVVWANVVRESAVADFARGLLDALAQPYRLEDLAVDAVSSSIGFACAPWDGEAPEDLLKAADAALYRAKEAGRARCMRALPIKLKAA